MTITYCVIMCEFMHRVGLVCQIYEASSKAAFYIAKELLVCNNRLRCNHPLIVVLFSNHLLATTSLCNDYTHNCLGLLQCCLPGQDLPAPYLYRRHTEKQKLLLSSSYLALRQACIDIPIHLSLFLTPFWHKRHISRTISLLLCAIHLLPQPRPSRQQFRH